MSEKGGNDQSIKDNKKKIFSESNQSNLKIRIN